MNIIGTVLERTEENSIYTKFKKTMIEKNPDYKEDSEGYDWKCYILKKYFNDNIFISCIRFVIGVLLLVLSTSSVIYKIFGNKGFTTILVVGCLIVGVILTGSGILFGFSNYKCLKNFKDYLWDEEGEVAEKIIRFYDKSR